MVRVHTVFCNTRPYVVDDNIIQQLKSGGPFSRVGWTVTGPRRGWAVRPDLKYPRIVKVDHVGGVLVMKRNAVCQRLWAQHACRQRAARSHASLQGMRNIPRRRVPFQDRIPRKQ